MHTNDGKRAYQHLTTKWVFLVTPACLPGFPFLVGQLNILPHGCRKTEATIVSNFSSWIINTWRFTFFPTGLTTWLPTGFHRFFSQLMPRLDSIRQSFCRGLRPASHFYAVLVVQQVCACVIDNAHKDLERK